MPTKPKLTICVPSRNRQPYFQKTIEGMVRNPRQDVQFVFTDNSDVPSVMNGYMERLRGDARIVYLPSADRMLSMMENWERTMCAATGEWVIFIGDDDHCDPDIADLIENVLRYVPDLDALSWGNIAYSWPAEGVAPGAVLVPTDARLLRLTSKQLQERLFGWAEATMVPTSGFSVYHSAVRKSLIDANRDRAGGRYFEHPVVDYDMAMKIVTTGRQFVYCERPFSVMGACPESNSFAIGRMQDLLTKVALFNAELGRSFDQDPYMKDFPFHNALGPTCSIIIAQQWFKSQYKFEYSGWEQNFTEAAARYVQQYLDRESFDGMRSAYVAALSKWRGGRFLKHFKPVFQEGKASIRSGFSPNGIYIRSTIAVAKNPHELFDVISGFVRPVDLIDVEGQLGAAQHSSTGKAILKSRAAGSRGRLR